MSSFEQYSILIKQSQEEPNEGVEKDPKGFFEYAKIRKYNRNSPVLMLQIRMKPLESEIFTCFSTVSPNRGKYLIIAEKMLFLQLER
jgi:hypothetical protein